MSEETNICENLEHVRLRDDHNQDTDEAII